MVHLKVSVFTIAEDARTRVLSETTTNVDDVKDINLDAMLQTFGLLYPNAKGIHLTIMP